MAYWISLPFVRSNIAIELAQTCDSAYDYWLFPGHPEEGNPAILIPQITLLLTTLQNILIIIPSEDFGDLLRYARETIDMLQQRAIDRANAATQHPLSMQANGREVLDLVRLKAAAELERIIDDPYCFWGLTMEECAADALFRLTRLRSAIEVLCNIVLVLSTKDNIIMEHQELIWRGILQCVGFAGWASVDELKCSNVFTRYFHMQNGWEVLGLVEQKAAENLKRVVEMEYPEYVFGPAAPDEQIAKATFMCERLKSSARTLYSILTITKNTQHQRIIEQAWWRYLTFRMMGAIEDDTGNMFPFFPFPYSS